MKNINMVDAKNMRLRNSIVLLPILCLAGFIVRMYFFPFDLPIRLDGLDYFLFAHSLSQEGTFPKGLLGTNDGWSIFLAGIFKLVNNNDFQVLNFIQRFVSVIFSCLTVYPVYYLCKRFSNERYALFGAAIFIFDFRIIENSISGITEPLFIFLITCMMVFAFRNDRTVYFSFILVGLASIVRYEALVSIIPLTIIIFMNKKLQNRERKILFGILLMVITILPIAYIRIQTDGYDGFSSHIIAGPQYVLSSETNNSVTTSADQSDSGITFLLNLVKNTPKFLVWSMIPIFMIFVPIGIYYSIKRKSGYLSRWIIFSIFMAIPAMYAYGRNIPETRYLYVLFPIFCAIASFFVFSVELTNKKMFGIICAVLIMSLVFFQLYSDDYTYEREIYKVTKKLPPVADGVNEYPGGKYLRVVVAEMEWPEPLLPNGDVKTTYMYQRIPTKGYDSLIKYIQESKDKGLTHLVATENNEARFLEELLESHDKYPFLIKEFDSIEHGYKNRIIIYKINYDLFG